MSSAENCFTNVIIQNLNNLYERIQKQLKQFEH